MLEEKKTRGGRVQRGGEKGALPLYPKVFDREWRGVEGALGKSPACPCSWGSWGSGRHGESPRDGGRGSSWTAHAKMGVHALEEKEERDGSNAKVSNDVQKILVVHVPMAYPNISKQNIPLGHPLPTPMEGVDGQVDFSVNMPGFR